MANKKSSSTAELDFAYVNAQDLGLNPENTTDFSPAGYAQCVRALLQNWRQGTVSCKGRSDVSFSNKKPWKQKGTGRARAGSARSPIWRKGGVIFGPQPRTKELTVTKGLKRKVCNSLLWQYLNDQKIVSLKWAPEETGPKTANAHKALKQAGLADKQLVLFVRPQDIYTQASFANIPNVRMLLFDQPNAYDLSLGQCWIFLNKDIDAFKEMVNTWI